MVSSSSPHQARPSLLDRIRVRDLPMWVTIVAVVLGLFALALGVSALVNPSSAQGWIAGADNIALSWGGRNAGLGIVLLVAVTMRSAAGYVVAFAGQILREVSDMILAAPNIGGIIFVAIFLAVDVAGLVFSMRAARTRATQ